MLMIKLTEGDEGLVCDATLNFESVIRPVLILNHSVELHTLLSSAGFNNFSFVIRYSNNTLLKSLK